MREEVKTNLNDNTKKVAEEKTPVVEKKATKKSGVVIDCNTLNVRRTPEVKKDNVLKEIEVNTRLKIVEEESTEEFYKVVLKDGTSGFAMKKYIK